MKKVFFYSMVLFFSSFVIGKEINGEKHIVVIIPSYNNARWYEKNLKSVLLQNYTNYHVLYTDDCSPDGTGELVENLVKLHGKQDRITVKRNTIRCKALKNIVDMIYQCEDDDIIVTLDGDDWLSNFNVLSYINKVYADPNVWITYGQYAEVHENGDYTPGFNKDIPDEVIENRGLRKQINAFSHLRTFYAGLFKKIKLEDLMYEGEFLPMSWDLGFMIPMMEMAYKNFKFISDYLYIYNGINDINDHKVSRELQHELDVIVRSRQPYEPLEKLF